MVIPLHEQNDGRAAATPSIIKKLKSLLTLSRVGDGGEAEAATSKAQELMERYAIDQAMLRDQESPDDEQGLGEVVAEVKVLDFPLSGRSDRWVIELVGAVSRTNGVFSLIHRGRYMSATGYEADVATVVEISNYLYREILAKVNDERCSHKLLHGFFPGTTYLNNFKHGVVETLGRRLNIAKERARQAAREAAKYGALSEAYEEAQKLAQEGSPERLLELDALVQTSPTTYALVRVEKAIEDVDHRREYISQWAKENITYGTGLRAHSVQHNAAARSAGKAAGETIPLSPATSRIDRVVVRQLSIVDIPMLQKGDRVELSITDNDGVKTYTGNILFTDEEHQTWNATKGTSPSPIGDYERDIILGVEPRGPHGDSEFTLTVRMDAIDGMDWWDDIIVGADSLRLIQA